MSITAGAVPMTITQQLMLEIAKFSHLGRHTYFLSVVATVKNQRLTCLAIERMLQYTTLTNYLRYFLIAHVSVTIILL